MKINRRTRGILAALLTVFLILAYISVVFLPHCHSTFDPECAQCAALQATRNTIAILLLCAPIYALGDRGFSILLAQNRDPNAQNDTLVGLKVKLSD